ncbi:MAG: leucine--tRNA ligase [Candidatus Shapirobacteria bacterium]|nr:leucine--tRNA ligase [Candidatus Shapirobacteria bacterium]
MPMDFKEVEKKWLKFWEEHPELYTAQNVSSRQKKYVLNEFPYPSGSGLHIGHTFSFTGGDVYARYWRMRGYNVMFPMGWDAFGLPTENYAIKMKRKPQEVAKENNDVFRNQMKRLAFSYDWSREVNTADPNYYKWTQWIFIKLFEKGLTEKKEMPINWCPSCKIGLANEEVVDGKCERCGTEVERRTISQWVVKITKYADRLIDGLKQTDFIEKVKMAQINWIGKSEGARVKFQISSRDVPRNVSTDFLEVFTTRPDTIYGVTFMVISPEHKIVEGLDSKEVKDYVKQARSKSDLERTELNKDKTGVFSGLYAINPVNNKEIPIWISDFVLASYGTGAIMAVPGHDERDFAFAKKFSLPIIEVIDKDGRMKDSEMINGMTKKESIKKIIDWLKEKGMGEGANSYHLRDWIFSRQHYWGEPIPMVKCPEHGWVPVAEDQLPVVLPEVEAYEPTDDGKSPLSKMTEWVKTTCPRCGKPAERETDTMPNWAGSDWYFLRYCDPYNDIVIANQELLKKWLPVDVYIGGDEHNTLHLLYSRFIYQFLWDLGMVPKEIPEPYFTRMSHGVILGTDNARMSKSKGNVIVPEIVADKYGVDVIRMYLMFMGPFEGTMAWNEKTLMGVKRFLDRLEKFVDEQINSQFASKQDNGLIINKMIKGVGEDVENFGFNTAIAKMMEGLNSLKEANKEEVETIIKLIAPLAPYTAEELWASCAKASEGSVHAQSWPKYDEAMLIETEINIPVAINGKVRGQLVVKEDAIKEAKELPKIKLWIEGKEIVKEIYIPGKMINFVIR